MTHITHRRLETRVPGLEAGYWLDPAPWPGAEPIRRNGPVGAFAFGFAVLLCLGWWATAPEVLVSSARREGGRVLACKHLVGTRVVERQFLLPAQGAEGHGCPIVRFG